MDTNNSQLNEDLFGRGKGDPDHTGKWVGKDKPQVSRQYEQRDPHMWERARQARILGLPEEDLLDEPDRMPDGSDEQGWDKETPF